VLRSFVKDMRNTREQGGLSITDGSVVITPRDRAFAQAVAERAERLASLLAVVDARPLAAVEGGRREQLKQLFGQWGAEAIACGAQPERVLWIDDMLMARVAVSMGAISASTQAIVNAAVARKVMSEFRELDIGTSLFMANYDPLNASNELIRHIASSSNWQAATDPLARLIGRLSGLSAPDWLRVVRVVIVEVMLNLPLVESRSAAVIAVLETLRRRRDRRALLQSLVRSGRGMFSLNVVHDAEFLEIIRLWAEQATI
jgi:hypothetical protein